MKCKMSPMIWVHHHSLIQAKAVCYRVSFIQEVFTMACDLHGIVSWTISMTTWERVRSAYGRGRESFLENVVNPIYRVIYEEAEKSKTTTDDHGKWRNYDDLNEFFWSPDCFEIGWPLRLEHDFFYVPPFRGHSVSNPAVSVDTTEGDGGREGNGDEEMGLDYSTLDTYVKWQSCMNATFCSWLKRSLDVLFFKARATKDGAHANRWLGKTNFVEIRSFLHIFRSFDRMWTFLIVSLQASIIMACHDLGSPIQMFDSKIFEDVISIFITSAALKLIQAILDIVFSWKARHMMDASRTLKLLLKLIVAVLWTIILPVFYFTSKRKYSCQSTYNFGWPGEWCLSSYVVAVTIYLMTNAIQMVLYFVPAISRYLETSNHWICKILSWWTEPRLYVGRGMQESQVSLFKYTFFWLLLLLSKLTFSYSFEIKPLISPTRKIMKIGVKKYDWHELFPKVKNNAGAISAVWAPVILVYFMDLQIWYSVYCALFGGVCGIFHHLGEIRTLGMLRSRFHSLPAAFSNSLIPPASRKGQGKHKSYFYKKFQKVSENKKNGVAAFILVWNQIIKTFRSEDLINNRELDLMTIPSSNLSAGMIRWPVFLLANELSRALCIAKDFVGKDADLFKKIKKDKCMICAVMECYESLKYILDILVLGELDKRIVSYIITEIEESVARSSFLENFKMTAIPALADKCTELAEHLIKRNEDNLHVVTRILQDIFELVTNDIMTNGSRILDLLYSQQPEGGNNVFSRNSEPPLFLSISYPLPISLNEQIKRFYLLLSVKDTAMDIPANLEARRRISFFATSLFMDMPNAPNVQNMLSFSVMTPYYMEEVKFSWEELSSSQEGVSIIYYMQKIYPDEWNNFLERMGCEDMDGSETKQKDGELRYRANPQEKISSADEWKSCLKDVGCENSDGKVDELRNWASFRGQTLSRTVRGMMYLRKAIRLQAFLDVPKNEEIFKGYDAVEGGNDMLSAQLDAIADMKFTYVISCQNFGSQKSLLDPKVDDIVDLMKRYPSLRVAYVEEKEESVGQKVYTSILLKAASDYSQEIYRIKLPGPPNIGEGKPENQNNAIIFTRGEALQTIDMNQDNYMEEAFKMRNLLQEFVKNQRWRPPTILGLREHVFTGSISSLAWFMSYQETSFVTIGQRLLANPLRVRFHYGHPDIFDRIFHITRGGISKASKTINLSEDVFAGFNSTLRRGHVTYHEYLQVGKGRDVGLNQISRFEAKVSNGNSEQTLSRDIYRLGHQFDFFRMLSCYFTTIGFYFNSLIAVIGIYIFLYGQLYLVLSGLAKALLEAKMQNIQSIETALASQSFIQLGLLTGLPMVVELTLEKGFLAAVEDFILMQLQLAAVFFTFTLGTKSHYYGRTILHGGAKYRPTGRKVVVFHASFTENYRLYSRSHFVKGFELLLLLIVYDFYRRSYQGSMAYVLITYSIWFLSLTWLFAPFLFNPSGFNWGKIMGDWKDWNKWIGEQGGIGISQSKSWESWWNDEQAHLRHSGLVGRLIEAMLSLRFFIYQYGVVYHLDISRQNKDFLVYAFSWTVILAVFLLVQAVNAGRYLFSENFHFVFRLFKAALFLGIVATIVILSFACQMSLKDLIVGSLAFLPTGWGLIMIAQTLRPVVERVGLWDFTTVLVRAYDYGMGVVLFAPVAVLAWMPIISAFQTRFLFNEAFNRHLQIQRILSGKEKHR